MLNQLHYKLGCYKNNWEIKTPSKKVKLLILGIICILKYYTTLSYFLSIGSVLL